MRGPLRSLRLSLLTLLVVIILYQSGLKKMGLFFARPTWKFQMQYWQGDLKRPQPSGW
ncbi:hypothetical protein NCH01_17370 [Neoasaia chiangmaiensis]|nr:hypothetical protein NCH01_17370 [Neoasaia chiangmaiensis]